MINKEYINTPEFCMICFREPEEAGKGKSARTFKLSKHHVKYNPEKIIFVHVKCHRKIHDPDNPMTQWIQYTKEEEKMFYKNRKQDDTTLGTKVKWNL